MAAAQPARRARNILFLIGDDHGCHTGAYGDAQAKMPTLDRLAAEGVRFANAFGTTASCSPSRSVMLSGLQNHTNGQYGLAHATHNFSCLPSIKPAPALLKAAGYQCGVIGKLHVNPESAFPWDYVAGGGRNVRAMAEAGRKFFQSAGNKPWYLHVGYTDPHRGRAAGTDGFGNKDYPGVTRTQFDPAKIKVPSFLPDLPETRADVAEYYEASNRLDQGIGMMLDALKEAGQLDNTLILYIGDNGMPFPNAKTTTYDAGLHLPFILRVPGQNRRGLVNNAMVSFVDILPTFLEWAGVKGPEYPLPGPQTCFRYWKRRTPPAGKRSTSRTPSRSHDVLPHSAACAPAVTSHIRNLFPELAYPFASDLWASPTWQAVLKQGEKGMLGRRPVSRFLRRPPEELYDITRDPDEVDNLASSAEHRGTLEKMRGQVDAWRRETKDPWVINDSYKRASG